MTTPLRNPFLDRAPPPLRAGPPRFAFSRTELLHLALGITALTLAFSLILGAGRGAAALVPRADNLVAALVAVATGFVLHEMAHKAVAQLYGHWAEFRAQFMGLGLTLLIAATLKLLVSAPGAVMIQGRVTPRENGIISLVGPGTNLVVGVAAWLPIEASALNLEATWPRILHVTAFVNALLAVFNLVPVGNLDGRKVWAWSRGAYVAAAAGALLLLVGVSVTSGLPAPR